MSSLLDQQPSSHNGVAPTNHNPISSTNNTSTETTNRDTMVAGIFKTTASDTPPESPSRKGLALMANNFLVNSVNKTPNNSHNQKSPKNSRRASYAGVGSTTGAGATEPLTPTRLSLIGGGSGSASNSNSPLPPPSSRLQPATATAPVVGHHKKSNSLVGFDPLLAVATMDGNVNNTYTAPLNTDCNNNNNNNNNKHSIGKAKETRSASLQAPVTPTPTAFSQEAAEAVPVALTNLTLSPPSPSNNAEQELSNELRKLAKGLSKASPQRPTPSGKISKSKFGRAGSLTPKFNLTPPFRTEKTTTAPTSAPGFTPAMKEKDPWTAPHRKLPWQRHRRSRSLETPDDVLQDTNNAAAVGLPDLTPRAGSFENDATNANTLLNNSISNNNNNRVVSKMASTAMIPSSAMMQDLYDVVQAQAKQDRSAVYSSLALPSLAKPAPTSFLTGKEIVRTSEQDPSPFQMEIPSLEQTIVAARLVQFVEVYRKEDLNLDLNMSLVGLNRMQMQKFVNAEPNTTTTAAAAAAASSSNSIHNAPQLATLTDAHRPVVESLLEAADDVTLAGFYATENAGSADVRREAVVFERQMQFIVVFRGTTPEQTQKTPFFKKNNKQTVLETLDDDVANADCKVYAAVKQAYIELERRVFDCLDRYMDENPFCDVVFAGSSVGGAMATLGAFRYATNRPMVRVCCQTFGSPKVGNRAFRQQANSLPNLKVVRVEYANDSKCFAPPGDVNGAHVGHSIVLSKKSETNNTLTAIACKFDDDHDARKHHLAKPNIFVAAFKKERDITSYASALEQMHQSKHRWVSDFKGEDGTGVLGKDNEQRQVV